MSNLHDMSKLVGNVDILFVTIDTLRYDVAQAAWRDGQLETLERHLGGKGWECRHTPATFTYAAHHAFFSGFLPTPAFPGTHARLFASKFSGSESTVEGTYVFDQPTLPQALSQIGYRTICIGGTGFFNPESSLGQVLPAMFDESHWSPAMSVTGRTSEREQVRCARERLGDLEDQPVFMFINISAVHQPNWFYGSQMAYDTLHTHSEALLAVDRALKPLFDSFKSRRPTFCIICSDHGTAYGEDGFHGHRLAHDVIWNVPYAEFVL